MCVLLVQFVSLFRWFVGSFPFPSCFKVRWRGGGEGEGEVKIIVSFIYFPLREPMEVEGEGGDS